MERKWEGREGKGEGEEKEEREKEGKGKVALWLLGDGRPCYVLRNFRVVFGYNCVKTS